MWRMGVLGLWVGCTGANADKAESTDRIVTDAGGGDADTDTDADADSDPTPTGTSGTTGATANGLDCDADWSAQTPPPGLPEGECITQTLACGDVVKQATAGGSQLYDDGFWTDHFMSATVDPGALDGVERVYLFEGLGPGEVVTFDVQSCEPLWGTSMYYGDVSGAFCDPDDLWTSGQHLSGAGSTSQTGSRLNGTVSGDYDVILILDTLDAVETNFVVTVSCGSAD